MEKESLATGIRKYGWIICLLACSATTMAQQVNPQPFVIPALREWKGAAGQFELTPTSSLVIDPASYTSLLPVVTTFRSDLQLLLPQYKLIVRKGTPVKGDIYFSLTPADTSIRAEGYELSVDRHIHVRAAEKSGAFWATRTLLQLLEQDSRHRQIPMGTAKDWPQFKVRGFVLDCGRKFFTIGFLRDYVKFMSYYKLNDFHVHLSDNGFKDFFGGNWDSTYSAFRLENSRYPGLTAKDGHYSKKEFVELQQLAAQYGVNIIPEIDVPAHSLAFTKAVPQIGSSKYGKDHLDLDNPLTYEVIDNVFREYLEGPVPVFQGKEVHIGTDEYSKKEAEKFRAFTDHYIRFVESFGKKVRLWGALTHAAGTTPVKSENVRMNLWYNGYADPKTMLADGYEGISTPDGWLYIVPAAGYYYDYLNTKNLYNKWTPNMIGDQTFAEDDPRIAGGAFAVWNDHVGNGITAKDVHHRVFPAMQVLSQKMWGGTATALSYDSFLLKSKQLGEGPGLNMMGRVAKKDLASLQFNFEKPLQPGSASSIASVKNVLITTVDNKKVLQLKGGNSYVQTKVPGIGYGYTVAFRIKPATGNPPDAVIFSSADAIVKLKQQATGKLGFSREGYHYYFNYTVPEDQWTTIVITGDNKGTSLFVNGVLIEKLEGAIQTFADTKKTMAKVQTLFFPLQYIGHPANAFNGWLDDIRVFDRVLTAAELAGLRP